MGNLKEKLTDYFVSWFIYLFLTFGKWKQKLFAPHTIKDKILYAKGGAPKIMAEINGTLGTEYINAMEINLAKNGDFECLVNGYFSLTGKTAGCGSKGKLLSQMLRDSKLNAAAFYQSGLRKGDVVHFLIPNCTDYHSLAIGVWACEGVCSVSDPGLAVSVMKKQMKDTNAKFIICFEANRKTVFDCLTELQWINDTKVIVLEKSMPDQNEDLPITEANFEFYQDFINNAESMPQPPLLQSGKMKDEETVLIYWSSGTTGDPKGIQYSLENFRANMGQMKKQGSFMRTLSTTCMFHAGGFLFPLYCVHGKTANIFNHGPDIDNENMCETVYALVDKFKPLWLMLGSHHLVQMSKTYPKNKSLNLKSVISASPMGSTVPLTLNEDLKKIFPNFVNVLHFYGMTELPNMGTITSDLSKLGSMWSKDMKMKLVDPDTGKLCGPGEVGEMYVSGPYKPMKGYLNRPDENKKFFAEDNWYRTGDLGRYDQKGHLYYEGRQKELIKYKNCHLYPLEIENVICKHPEVVEAGVFGRPDDTVQELVTAAVVKVPGSKVTENEIIDLVNAQVDDAKKLRGGVIFVDHLPKSVTGKTQRRKLMELYVK